MNVIIFSNTKVTESKGVRDKGKIEERRCLVEREKEKKEKKQRIQPPKS